MKIFSVLILVAAIAHGARVPIDARFIQDGERSVRGWTFNKVECYKPFGDVFAVMADGVPGVRLASKGKNTTLYQTVPTSVSPGEVYVMRAKVRGNGHAALGFFAYGPKWSWKGSHGSQFACDAGGNGPMQLVEARFVVPEGIETVRVTLTALPGGDVSFFDVTLEKERGAE